MKFHLIPVLVIGLVIGFIGSGHANDQSVIRPGDHVAIVGNTFADQLRIHSYLETLLMQSIQGKSVSIRNLGWGGDMLTARDRPTNFPTEESTLMQHRTDVIIACFGMGESFAGEEGLENFKQDVAAFIESHEGKKYNGKNQVRLVLVSPIAYEDLGVRTPKHKKRNRDLEKYSQAMEEVAQAAKLPFVDLFHPTRYLMEEASAARLTTNGIHLNAFGYWVASRILFEHLVNAKGLQPWRLSIDAKAETGTARGLRLEELNCEKDEITFQAIEEAGPTLAPPTEEVLAPQLMEYRDQLRVENLMPGKYTLFIDNQEVMTASHENWANGLVIDSSPAHLEAQSLRQAVIDKNLQFTYSWKALNQVHIVGERRNSPSGQALPAEVIEFNKLAEKRDHALHTEGFLKTRQWRLTRTSK